MAGQGAHATGGGVEQNGFTAFELIGLAQQVLHGQAFEHGTGGLFKADLIRQVHQVGGGQHVRLAVGTQRAAAVGHTVADFELADFTANGIDYASTFRTQTRWQGRRRIEATAEVGVDEVQADRLVAHPNLLWARFRWRVVHIFKYVGAAMGAELDTFGHLHFSLGSVAPYRTPKLDLRQLLCT